MRKILLATLIVIPFFWSSTELKTPSKLLAHPPAKVWNLPDAVKKFVTTSTVYKAVEYSASKLWSF